MSTATITVTDKILSRRDRRPHPEADDYIGKGRVAACVAKRRYSIRTQGDEMQDMIQEAAATYWHTLEHRGKSPAYAWVRAMHQARTYYWRTLRESPSPDIKPPLSLDAPLDDGEDGFTLYSLADVAEAARQGDDDHTLDWLSVEDLEQALIEGRRAAGCSKRSISYSIGQGTVAQEGRIIRLAAQGHTNASIATLLGTTEGTIRNRRQRIRRWLTALAEETGAAGQVEAWDTTGGDQAKARAIQLTYPDGQKPEAGHV